MSGAPTVTPVELAIVGGGAAGLFAAEVASELKIPCLLLERKARVGSKMLMTANGRCNFTKDVSPEQFLRDLRCGEANARAAAFVAEAVRACPPRTIIAGFKSMGVMVRRTTDGRLFPSDGKAASVVHAFGDALRDAEVPIVTNCPVREIVRNANRFLVRCRAFDLEARRVLLATGGVSYPKTGSVGDGQKFAQALGHRLVPYRPGLIGFETADRRVTSLAGQRFEEGRARVLAPDGRLLYDYRGEVDCESFGLSGAAIYNCQRFVAHLHLADFRLEVAFGRNRLSFANLRPRPLKEAIVTLGGVSTDEINPHTMESKIVPGLFFAGEVMDIDGPTGGYNLTLAFATAHRAVCSLREKR